MAILKEIVDAYSIENISETYPGDIEITDLKGELGTKGHVLVIRGDKAYRDELKKAELPLNLSNPKFWLYENIINSPRIQKELQKHPEHKLFDGVGFSGLDSLGFHAKKLGRKTVVVMAHEMLPDPKVFDRYNIEIIHGDGPAEEGYVEKQAEVIEKRNDIIPLHQALYGAQALAPIGNKVVSKLEELCIIPNASFWSIASGSNLYGIGKKIKQRFSNCETTVVEPERWRTLNSSLDPKNHIQVKEFAKRQLKDYSLENWDKTFSGIFPLHVAHPNRYMLLLWAHTGNLGFDRIVGVPTSHVLAIKDELKKLNQEYDWTKSTALTLKPAIESAEKGKNVVVMAYGKHREHAYRDLIINNNGER